MKKTLNFTSWPVVYTKLIFTELMESIEQVVKNSVVETLILEGLPIRDCYVLKLTNGMAENSSSLKHLSFQRCNLGDAAAAEICQTVSTMMNLESLDLSGCDLSLQGVEAIANIIKMQKIHRYSKAWADSLRYRDVNSNEFIGLRTVNIKNNPEIGNAGVKLITETLSDDEWIKEVDMENCGIGNEGAEHIINCLNVNKTISSFSIAQNLDISDQYQKHIILHLGSSSDSSGSSNSLESLDSEIPSNVTKSELLEKVKFLRYRYEVELKRRKRVEELFDKQNDSMKQMKQCLEVQGAFKIPDGFTLVDNDTLDRLINEKIIPRAPLRLKKSYHVRKLILPRQIASCKSIRPISIPKSTKSECQIENVPAAKVYFEQKVGDNCDETRPSTVATITNEVGDKKLDENLAQNIGDCRESRPNTSTTLIYELEVGNQFNEIGDTIVTHQQNDNPEKEKSSQNIIDELFGFNPRNLFKQSSNLVPWNSDAESDD